MGTISAKDAEEYEITCIRAFGALRAGMRFKLTEQNSTSSDRYRHSVLGKIIDLVLDRKGWHFSVTRCDFFLICYICGGNWCLEFAQNVHYNNCISKQVSSACFASLSSVNSLQPKDRLSHQLSSAPSGTKPLRPRAPRGKL